MKSLLIIIALSITTTYATEVSFEGNNTFSPVHIQGRLSASCGKRMQYFTCTRDYLKEGNFARLTTGQAVDADRVEITNLTNERVKKSKYKAKKNRTRKSFNLWVDTLTQRSLLDHDENEIEYKFFKDDEEVLTGRFSADVSASIVRSCPRSNIRFQRGNCPSQQQICDMYFQRFNNCQ